LSVKLEETKFDVLKMKLLIRHEIFLQRYSVTSEAVTKASDDQIKRAADLIKRVDLKDFSVFQFTNPGKLLPPLAQPLSLLNDIVFILLVSFTLIIKIL
jgi:hypothetical protein